MVTVLPEISFMWSSLPTYDSRSTLNIVHVVIIANI
jgi:hypothetical protein